jgi:hypothetical protein
MQNPMRRWHFLASTLAAVALVGCATQNEVVDGPEELVTHQPASYTPLGSIAVNPQARDQFRIDETTPLW